MPDKNKHSIVVFEHEVLRFDKGEKRITEDQFKVLQHYYGNGVPFYKLIYNGVQFNEHVGVIQLGKTIIEVLPKADRYTDEGAWRQVLIGMLKASGVFDVKSTSNSNLKIKPNNILDLYFELFINEVEYLLHTGLIKKYCKKQGNVTALKGSIHFGRHIQQNITHQERFYVNYTSYDVHHKIHFILYKAIQLLKRINTNAALHGRIGALLLNFPEMPEVKIIQTDFDKLIFNRKTTAYKTAINIAKLLLLQYHPDIKKGKNDVLALMFDMNMLWEQFVFVTLKRKKKFSGQVHPQTFRYFWQPENGYRSKIQPDIWIDIENKHFIIDTKWKNLNGYNPSPDDLRQMYVYHTYYNAKNVALVYPGEMQINKGKYIHHESGQTGEMECGVICIEVNKDIKAWQEEICRIFEAWINNG